MCPTFKHLFVVAILTNKTIHQGILFGLRCQNLAQQVLLLQKIGIHFRVAAANVLVWRFPAAKQSAFSFKAPHEPE